MPLAIVFVRTMVSSAPVPLGDPYALYPAMSTERTKISPMEPRSNHRVILPAYHGEQIASIDQTRTPLAVVDTVAFSFDAAPVPLFDEAGGAPLSRRIANAHGGSSKQGLMENRVATLKDVAELAGVGMSTASRAISGKGPVSAEAAARVKAAIETLNFRPSSIGRAMATRQLGIIGIFVPTFFGSYYGTILKQTDTELRAVHRHVVVATGCGEGSPREQAIEAVRFLIGRDCDGVVVISHDLHDEDLIMLHRMHPKMVFLNRAFEQLPDASFCADHRRGGELAARTLLDFGHREIGVIAGPASASDNVMRIDGFFAELARAGIAREDVTLIESDFSPEGGYAAAQKLLDTKRRVTGLFCANDTMAVSVLARFYEAGISVPNDISVIGYDDDYSAPYAAPGLTSVHIPTAELTRNAVRWLINACYRTTWEIFREFPVSVTMRASVGPAPDSRKTS